MESGTSGVDEPVGGRGQLDQRRNGIGKIELMIGNIGKGSRELGGAASPDADYRLAAGGQ